MLVLNIVFLFMGVVFARPYVDDDYCKKDGTCTQNADILNKAPSVFTRPSKKPTPKELCEICDLALPVIRSLIIKNKTEHFENIAVFFCTEFKIVDPIVCSYVIKEYEFAVLDIIKDTRLSTGELCGIALNCRPVHNPLFDWNITLPNVPKPTPVTPKPPKEGAPTLRVLQLSDIHIDYEYQPGSVADCSDPLCCRNRSKPATYKRDDDIRAGFWGDYRNCDVPIWTVENMFKHIAENEEFDIVYWTGDIPAHNVWNQSKSDQIKALSHLSDLFLKYFSDKIIFPTLGNHEAAPCNLFPTPFVKEDSIDWLYSAVAKNWTATGLPEELAKNISIGAFYTVPLYPGFRLVSLNMNYCDNGNFWLIINSTDIFGQLEWLANVLQQSENIGEKVHIIGHIMPHSCMVSWSRSYYRIINRYENTVAGQFFGHSHSDYFTIFYDTDNIRPISVAYISPSVTTYSYLNPGYRVYTIDGYYPGSTFQVLNHETVILNLTDANLTNEPKWQSEYTTRDAFNMKTAFPEDWNNLVLQAANDLDGPIFKNLYKFYQKSYDKPPDCDTNCKKDFLCSYKQARSDISIPCF